MNDQEKETPEQAIDHIEGDGADLKKRGGTGGGEGWKKHEISTLFKGKALWMKHVSVRSESPAEKKSGVLWIGRLSANLLNGSVLL